MPESQATASPESQYEAKRPLNSPSDSTKPSKISKRLREEEREERDPGLMNPNPSRIQRYLVAVEYIGTKFSGSAKQPNCTTVTGALEEAFHKFVGQPVSIVFSSRTDAGVHALSNVCHVDVERISKRKPTEVLPPHESGVVRRAVNHFLQKGDLRLIDVRCVPVDFHARFKALERTYFYRLLSGPEPLSTFEKERAWHVPQELDILAIKKACNILIGPHDFSSFRASGCQANSPIKTLDELHICEVPSLSFPSYMERTEMESATDHLIPPSMSIENCNRKRNHEFGQRPRHHCYVVTARARSFLYHQVRLLVGVLKCVGTGDLTSCDVERILNARTVTAASPMAPACGLYLGSVKYDLPDDSEG